MATQQQGAYYQLPAALLLLALLGPPSGSPGAAAPAQVASSAAAVATAAGRAPAAAAASAAFLFTPDVVASTNLTRAAGRPVKGDGPVLVAEHPWENSLIFGHSIITVGAVIRLYYNTYTATSGSFVCMATSSDEGRTFTKPNLGLVAFCNTSATNIVLALTREPGKVVVAGAAFVDDRAGVPPDARYKLTSEHAGNVGMDMWASADGLSWRLLVPRMLPSYFADTQAVVYFDPASKEYLAYGRLHAGTPPSTEPARACPGASASYRQVGFASTRNSSLTSWSPVKQILGFQGLPQCVDVYNNAAVKAASNAYLMLPSLFRHFPTDPANLPGSDGVLDVRLAISSDGQVRSAGASFPAPLTPTTTLCCWI